MAGGIPMNHDQLEKMRSGAGFIAALDQSGGSTPGALAAYGVDDSQYADEAQMFDRMHEMRARIMTSPSFGGDRILGAILFEDTMNRQVAGRDTSDYLWSVKQVVPFLKIDKGLAPEADGVQLMKPIPGVRELLERGIAHGVFGTKMRSVIKLADPGGVAAIVSQQFEVAREVLASGLVPIIEPEIDIASPQKAAAEKLLRAAIEAGLDRLDSGHRVMLKLTLPEEDGFYGQLASHPRVLRVVALSGGYSRDEADRLLARNPGIIASFSRALTEGLSVDQSDSEFNAQLDRAIASIYEASLT
jgi:fructose-bisphosphate aldolase class I